MATATGASVTPTPDARVTTVVRTYVELRAPAQLRRADFPAGAIRFVQREPCTVDHARWLYRAVGERWHWRDRNAWTDDRFATYLASPAVTVWELRVDDEVAGYAEMRRDDDGSVEITSFGLIERFTGRRLGAAMLTAAAEQAWAMGATRVWLHTCTLDSPAALPNYLARGFKAYRTETYERAD
jgi:GNAT superfamily N-acetyltransferase